MKIASEVTQNQEHLCGYICPYISWKDRILVLFYLPLDSHISWEEKTTTTTKTQQNKQTKKAFGMVT